MHPYERRRDGDLAGTTGSSAPSFPVALATEWPVLGGLLPRQAPAPPELAGVIDYWPVWPFASAAAGSPYPRRAQAPELGVARPAAGSPSSSSAPAVARRPSENGIFVNYENARWFSSGGSVVFAPARFVKAGVTNGFPVDRARGGTGSTIYVAISKDAPDTLAPYSKR
jgi:hypothetical protein